MPPTRNLRLGASGPDVRKLKEQLLLLGCFAPQITQLRTDVFGMDTRDAVRRFQAANGLTADGIVGPQTRLALARAQAPLEPGDTRPADAAAPGTPPLPEQIGPDAAGAVSAALAATSGIRQDIVRDALQFAFDQRAPRAFPLSLYIRGGNLYGSDLRLNVITLARIASGAARQPQYYDGGRRELMERAVRNNPLITGADCSGGVVGLLRHAGVVKPGFDLSANGFRDNRARYRPIAREALEPADLVHKEGHIGLYAGGGYVVEWMGGAYGCQLTRLSDRRGWNFITGRASRMGAWTGFLRPTYY